MSAELFGAVLWQVLFGMDWNPSKLFPATGEAARCLRMCMERLVGLPRELLLEVFLFVLDSVDVEIKLHCILMVDNFCGTVCAMEETIGEPTFTDDIDNSGTIGFVKDSIHVVAAGFADGGTTGEVRWDVLNAVEHLGFHLCRLPVSLLFDALRI